MEDAGVAGAVVLIWGELRWELEVAAREEEVFDTESESCWLFVVDGFEVKEKEVEGGTVEEEEGRDGGTWAELVEFLAERLGLKDRLEDEEELVGVEFTWLKLLLLEEVEEEVSTI